ncbi:CocE/NonD family hydrolase C-terminal non-catalytic domain-containing protein [Streptomyces sp. NPDC058642]|uniref:CocE/NonD family hydrolase C-terminal non-catalytic domain-containing protein n=1 Tax=Streptomyces sp. NPDC058642 TaxID=3346572 RepID=UPI00364F698F
MTEIRIEFDVPAQMRDGTVLRADVYRPAGTGPWPVLLARLSYGKQTPMMGVVLDPLAAARPGEAGEHVVDLWSTSIVFKAGHRIRVQVTSSNFPRWDRNLNTGEPEESATTARSARQQLFHDPSRPSRIVLPVVAAP